MLGESTQRTITVKDLPADDFIKGYAEHLKKNNQLQIPAWVDLVKTSKANQLAPTDPDWLYIRVAALARKLFLRPRLGVGLLTTLYGGSQRRGVCKPRFCKSGGKVIRWSLQQLQKLKVLKKIKNNSDKKADPLKINSRIMSKEGIKNLNKIAAQINKAKKA